MRHVSVESLFADDSVSYRTIKNQSDHEILLADAKQVFHWANINLADEIQCH